MTTETTPEKARELAERLRACASDMAIYERADVTIIRLRRQRNNAVELARKALAALTALTKERDALREALTAMVYETTHLSPQGPDSRLHCTISGKALIFARAALNKEAK